MFITTFASPCHLSLSRVRSIQFMPLYPTSWRSFLLLSSHLRLCLSSFSFCQVTPPKPCVHLLCLPNVRPSAKFPTQIQFPLRTHSVSMIIKKLVMLYREIIDIYCKRCTKEVVRDSVVGVTTDYGLDGFRWGWSFSHPSWPALGLTQPSTQWVPDHSRGLQRPGGDFNHSSPSFTEVKEKVKL